MADIKKFPTRHLDTLRHGYNKFIKGGASMGEWAKLTKGLPQEDVDFLMDRRNKDFPGLNPERIKMGPKDQAEFDVAQQRRKQLRTPPGKPYVIKGGASDISVVDNKNREWEFTKKRARKISDPNLRAVAKGWEGVWDAAGPKVSKSGFKWGTAAKVAGKALGGVGVVADLLTPPISNGKVRRHPVFDRIAEIPKKQKQKRNPYSNGVTLGIK